MALTTLAKVKSYLGIPTATTTDDDLITSFMNSSISFITQETDQIFEPTTLTKYYGKDSVDGRKLLLDEYIQSVDTVTNGDTEETEIASSNYFLMPKNKNAFTEIWLTSSSIYSWEYDDSEGEFITIEGSFGLFSSVPTIIEHTANRLTAYLYRQKDNHQDLDRAVVASSGVILPSSIPTDVLRVLKDYRKII